MAPDPDRDEFHMWIGYCISSWARVEERLFEVCWAALSCPKERAAIVYYRTPTLDARLKLTDKLVRSALPKPARKSGGHLHRHVSIWEALKREITSQLQTRSRIAHQPVGIWQTPVPMDNDEDEFLLTSYLLFMSENEVLRGRTASPHALDVTHLVDHNYAVTRLAGELGIFCRDAFSTRPSKSLEQTPDKS